MKVTSMIDHTILKAEATKDQIIKLCNEAKEYHFASVCVNTCWVPLCKELLEGTGVAVCTVVGFPLGAMKTESKAFETEQAVRDGADEIDMVINVGEAKAGNFEFVEKDIKAVVDAAGGKLVKVIIEACLLEDDEKVKACQASVNAGADYVKTSTGFSKWGAKVEDVRLMKETVGDKAKVKAAGGIRTYKDCLAMIEAGASRIGASAGITIAAEENAQ